MSDTLTQTLLQRSVDQGEGKPLAVFELCDDKESSEEWRKMIMEKVRQFGVAIQIRTGYHVVLRRQQSLNGVDILYVDIREARQSYAFMVNDNSCCYSIRKEVV